MSEFTSISATPATARTVAARPDLGLLGDLLASALDEVDYGIALLDASAHVLHMNRQASKLLLQANGPLHIVQGQLRTRDSAESSALLEALSAAARRGLRRLLSHACGESRQIAALVPVQPGCAVLMLGRAKVCEDISLQWFARTHALTVAETRVLAALGRGVAPSEIARIQGVKLSTVRTQIGAIRDKTGTGSIIDLVRLVAALPPIMGVLSI
jgi:DNA-binding CsgD family transcriptional regulator